MKFLWKQKAYLASTPSVPQKPSPNPQSTRIFSLKTIRWSIQMWWGTILVSKYSSLIDSKILQARCTRQMYPTIASIH